MQDRVIFRLTAEDEGNLGAVLDALKARAGSYQDRYPTRTRAVREALQIAAAQLSSGASSSEKQAISQIAAEKTSAGKAAILQSYLAANPGADQSRFTPQLMKGI